MFLFLIFMPQIFYTSFDIKNVACLTVVGDADRLGVILLQLQIFYYQPEIFYYHSVCTHCSW